MNERITATVDENGVTLVEAAPDWPVACAARRFTVEVFDGHDLDRARWPAVDAASDLLMHVFQAREFLDVWMATIGKARGSRHFLIVIKDAFGRPVFYLPLALETKLNIRVLRFMDAGVSDFNAPILAAGHDFTQAEFLALWDDILARLPAVDVVDLQKISSHVCNGHNPLTFLDCRPYPSSGHAIALARLDDGSGLARSIQRMHRKFTRKCQRLGESGATAFLANPPAPETDRVMDALVELKRQQYLRTTGSDFFAMPGVYEFYRQMATPERLGRISHLSALTCGGKVVSGHLGFIGRGRFYWVLPAFDTDYKPWAVGNVLLDWLIMNSAATGYTDFDLGEGDYSYKKKWATDSLPLFSHERALTAAGTLYQQLKRIRRFVRDNPIVDSIAKSRLFAPPERHAD